MSCRGRWLVSWSQRAMWCADLSCSIMCAGSCGVAEHLSVVQLRRIILDCAVELSTKTPIYATLIGAWAHWLFALQSAPCSFKVATNTGSISFLVMRCRRPAQYGEPPVRGGAGCLGASGVQRSCSRA